MPLPVRLPPETSTRTQIAALVFTMTNAVLFGFGLPDDNLHAPNEKFNLDNFFNGILASAFLYEEIADLPK